MTDELLHDIFGRFQNINLIRLIHDLEDGKVARRVWCAFVPIGFGHIKIGCPVAHGVNVFESGRWIVHVRKKASAGLGVPVGGIMAFTTWWDLYDLPDDIQPEDVVRELKERPARLLTFLRALLAEHLADADAVQSAIEDRPVPVSLRFEREDKPLLDPDAGIIEQPVEEACHA